MLYRCTGTNIQESTNATPMKINREKDSQTEFFKLLYCISSILTSAQGKAEKNVPLLCSKTKYNFKNHMLFHKMKPYRSSGREQKSDHFPILKPA